VGEYEEVQPPQPSSENGIQKSSSSSINNKNKTAALLAHPLYLGFSLAVAVQAQRIQMHIMNDVGEELRRAVAAKEADQAVAVEHAQRIQADYFKRMIAGQIAKDAELSASPSMRSVQKALLDEIAAHAKGEAK
jgi:hypothetical protein